MDNGYQIICDWMKRSVPELKKLLFEIAIKINLTFTERSISYIYMEVFIPGRGISMKITTDVNSAGIRPGGNVLPRSNTDSRSINTSDAKVAQDVILKMQREKSLVDALVIAQSSRELVQKALNISSRLMSLASEAMISGRVNADEVSTQMSSINISMAGYGERVSAPVESPQVPVNNAQVKLNENFAALKEKAGDMMSGKPVAKTEFEPITAGLKEVVSEYDAMIKSYSKELGSVKRIEDFSFNYTGLNRNTADMVVGNPVKALESQGNISYDMAGKLTLA